MEAEQERRFAMRGKAMKVAVLSLVVAVLAAAAPALSMDYAVMLSRNINIRTGPGTGYFIVCRAWKGDVFELVGETGSWYEIVMFSGESRYVSKTWAARLTESQLLPGHRMVSPAADDTLRAVYRDILHAKDRAGREADEIIPVSIDTHSNKALREVLEDSHVMEVMAMYSIQPALYHEIVDRATRGDSIAGMTD
jgi:hypothetical protein